MRRAERGRVHEILHTVFHLQQFRSGQEEVIDAALRGRDALALFPTGAGKSLCYQLPALLFKGPTLVVSPLIALMRDQVAHLERLGIPALCLDSLQDSGVYESNVSLIREGWPRLIYVSPERLQVLSFRRLLLEHPPSMVVVDEAHCVVQWGESFRPAYREIADFLRELPSRPVLLAMTATADRRMRLQIAAGLTMRHPRTVTLPIVRPNLRYLMQTTLQPADCIRQYALRHAGQKGLVFCATRKRSESLAASLDGLATDSGARLRAAFYHAGMERDERTRVQDAFLAGEYDVLAVTSAFGMGVDIPDIRYTIHDSLPRSMLDLAQQTGRAGRDGLQSDCILLLSPVDLQWLQYLLGRQRVEAKTRRDALKVYVSWRDLRRVLDALLSGRCIPSEIAACFGNREKPCGSCSACQRRKSLGLAGRVEAIAPTPDLYHMSSQDLRLWSLEWERKALAHSLRIRPGQVLATEDMLKSARMGKLCGECATPEAATSLERLLRVLRTVK